jgi:hypothetical protein
MPCVIAIAKDKGSSKTHVHHNPMGFGGVASRGASPPHQGCFVESFLVLFIGILYMIPL